VVTGQREKPETSDNRLKSESLYKKGKKGCYAEISA